VLNTEIVERIIYIYILLRRSVEYMVTLNFVTDLIKNILMLKRFLKILLCYKIVVYRVDFGMNNR
jgi:hypothetical protein